MPAELGSGSPPRQLGPLPVLAGVVAVGVLGFYVERWASEQEDAIEAEELLAKLRRLGFDAVRKEPTP